MPREKIERNDQMVRDYEGGDSLWTIARRNGITQERVRQILERRGVVRRPPTGGRRTEATP